MSPSLAQLCAAAAAAIHFTTTHAAQSYKIAEEYTPDNFFSKFNFFVSDFTTANGWDPTHGFVNYRNQSDAQSLSLISTTKSDVYIGVNHQDTFLSADGTPATKGRDSVRIESLSTYSTGLIVASFSHLPQQTCGTWPSFWAYGETWLTKGEIDMYEGWNLPGYSTIAGHTDPSYAGSCSLNSSSVYSKGTASTTDCNNNLVNPPTQYQGTGCAVKDHEGIWSSNTGGTIALEITSKSVRVWTWLPGSVPTDVLTGSPNPDASWGLPEFLITDDACDIPTAFQNQKLVFNIDFCGDTAGNSALWAQSCSSKAATCSDFVAANPSAFADVYWQIEGIKVYQLQETPSSSSSVFMASSTSSTASSASSVAITSSASSASSIVGSSSATLPTSSSTTSYSSSAAAVSNAIPSMSSIAVSASSVAITSSTSSSVIMSSSIDSRVSFSDASSSSATVVSSTSPVAPSPTAASSSFAASASSFYIVPFNSTLIATSFVSQPTASDHFNSTQPAGDDDEYYCDDDDAEPEDEEEDETCDDEEEVEEDETCDDEDDDTSTVSFALIPMTRPSKIITASGLASQTGASSVSSSAAKSDASAGKIMASTSAGMQVTTVTIFSTQVYTITACPSTVSNCPLGSKTSTLIPVTTTVFPVTKAQTVAAAPISQFTASTVYSTKTYTITSCATTIPDCPVGRVTTEIVALYTTICPVTAGAAPTTLVTPGTTSGSSGSHGTGSNPGLSNSGSGSNKDISGSGSGSGSGSITSTIVLTTTFTITSCAPIVTDCPVGKVTSSVITTTTIISATASASSLSDTKTPAGPGFFTFKPIGSGLGISGVAQATGASHTRSIASTTASSFLDKATTSASSSKAPVVISGAVRTEAASVVLGVVAIIWIIAF